MNQFSFLTNIVIAEDTTNVKDAKPAVSRKIPRTPEDGVADLRVFRTGIYPSAALVSEFNLEYYAKDLETGNGFDIFDSADWKVSKDWPARLLLIGAVPKKAGKVTLFDIVKYDAEGKPLTSVLEQGAAPGFAKVLIQLCEMIYGKTINEQGYIDLKLYRETPITTPNNIVYVPKEKSRGEAKGQPDYIKREWMTLFPLAPIDGSTEFVAGVETDVENLVDKATEDLTSQEEQSETIAEDITESLAPSPFGNGAKSPFSMR